MAVIMIAMPSNLNRVASPPTIDQPLHASSYPEAFHNRHHVFLQVRSHPCSRTVRHSTYLQLPICPTNYSPRSILAQNCTFNDIKCPATGSFNVCNGASLGKLQNLSHSLAQMLIIISIKYNFPMLERMPTTC